jgi:2',3'-cyclic-nucleotide 2'-phosphodiesterase (5'-nucleotidase family)
MSNRLLGLAIGLCLATSIYADDFTLTLLHTNDAHSQLEAFTPYGEPEQAGAARRMTLIEAVRAQVGEHYVLTVDAGDFSQGSLFYNAWRGSADMMALNAMRYDAVALGNHEFALGSSNLARLLKGQPVQIADRIYATEAPKMPILSANLDVTADPDLHDAPLAPFAVVDKAGQRIGIIGAITPDLTVIANTGSDVRVLDYRKSVLRAVSALVRDGVNKIVLLSHAGYAADLAMLPSLAGIDIVVSAHDHPLLGDADAIAAMGLAEQAEQVVGPYPTVLRNAFGHTTLLVGAYEKGRWLGRLDVTFDDAGDIIDWYGAPIFVQGCDGDDCSQAVAEADPFMATLVQAYAKPVADFSQDSLGEAGMFFDGSQNPGLRTQEMALGNLVADSMLELASRYDSAVVALINSGGLRAGIEAGRVTFGDILTVLPFGNTITVVDVSGEALVAALDNGLTWAYDAATGVSRTTGAFPQVAGMRVTYCGDRVAAIRAAEPNLPACAASLLAGGVVTGLSVAGRAVALEATYRVATNNFLMGGGDNYQMFAEACAAGRYCVDTGVLVVDALADEFFRHSPVERLVEGRIQAR